MSAENFMELVAEQDGFEFYQAYGNDIDHILGGREDTFFANFFTGVHFSPQSSA